MVEWVGGVLLPQSVTGHAGWICGLRVSGLEVSKSQVKLCPLKRPTSNLNLGPKVFIKQREGKVKVLLGHHRRIMMQGVVL